MQPTTNKKPAADPKQPAPAAPSSKQSIPVPAVSSKQNIAVPQQPKAEKSPNRVKFADDQPRDPDEKRYDWKRGPSKYSTMSKEQKMDLYMQRLQEDKNRAAQILGQLKKDSAKKKHFVTKKSTYDITSGNPVCITKMFDKDVYILGQANGKLVTVNLVQKKTGHIEPVEKVAGKVEKSILCIRSTPSNMIAVFDDDMKLTFFQDGKLLNSMQTDVNLEFEYMKIGKFFDADESSFYYIKGSRDCVVKVDPTSFSAEEVNLNRGKLYQIAVHRERIFAISEEGFVVSCASFVKEQMTPDQLEAYPDGVALEQKEILRFNDKDLEVKAKFLKGNLFEEEDYLQVIDEALSGGKGTDTQHMNSLMEKSNVANKKEYLEWEQTFFDHASLKVLNFHSIACTEDLVALVVDDGKGLNCLCIYTHALVLKAMRLFKVGPNDYSYSLGKSVQNLKMVKLSAEKTMIYAQVQKYNTVYVFSYDSNKIVFVTKVADMHGQYITDLFVQENRVVTVGKDKKLGVVEVDTNYRQVD